MKTLLAGLILLVTFPAVVGSAAATIATTPHPAPAVRLFSWVPAGGYPDHFPYGQCTWWAAYNRHVTWNGNAGDWLANASAQGFHTQPMPSVGAIAVYRPGSGYSQLGHVAVVVEVSSTTYTVSEMNFIGWGEVDTRTVWWPDPHVEGFIPLQEGGIQ
ncbi:MAG: CHAP domain-containing protein [Candidatus Dormibacteraceae bacterium]